VVTKTTESVRFDLTGAVGGPGGIRVWVVPVQDGAGVFSCQACRVADELKRRVCPVCYIGPEVRASPQTEKAAQ
jgi:hypothetical protein